MNDLIKIETKNGVISFKCSDCGCVLAQAIADSANFTFTNHIVCCGKIRTGEHKQIGF